MYACFATCSAFVTSVPRPSAVVQRRDVVYMACPPPQSLSRTQPRVAFDVELTKPMGLVLEELPGRVFVAWINPETGSAAQSRGAVLSGDCLVAVQGQSCHGMGVDQVMDLITGAETESLALRLSRDSSVVGVSFEHGVAVTALVGEKLRDIAVRAGHKVTFDCNTGRCGTCEHRVGAETGPLAKYARFCIQPLTHRTPPPEGAPVPTVEFFKSERQSWRN